MAKWRMRRGVTVTVLAVLSGCAMGAGASRIAAQEPQSPKTLNDGVFTERQAQRGEALFKNNCTTCHDTARFTGDVFIGNWAGQPIYALFDLVRTTMPEDNPGALQLQQYADVLAFFFRLNGFPMGSEELMGTDDAMRAVRIEAAKTGG
jgi:mono/diheme cytochrome c family protein